MGALKNNVRTNPDVMGKNGTRTYYSHKQRGNRALDRDKKVCEGCIFFVILPECRVRQGMEK
jgi:hypothetical protein